MNTVPNTVPLKDHEIAELVNRLTDAARQYHATQQLRSRLSRIINEYEVSKRVPD